MVTTVLDVQSRNGLGIVQLATAGQDSFSYISSGKALHDKAIEVREVSAAGSVNTLIVLNHSDKFIFFMDGDILVGAKQNRVVNTSILLAPQSKTTLPVSCVEQGRWRHVSPDFKGVEFTAPSSLRAQKAQQIKMSLKENRGFVSNQGEIWEGVSSYHRSTGVHSDSMDLSHVYEQKQNEFDEFVKSFSLHPEANGMCVFSGKELTSIDVFNRKDVMQEYFVKILRGVALDKYSRKHTDGVSEAEAKYRAQEFFDDFDQFEFETYPGAGVGEEKRFESGLLHGFALNYASHLIHLTALKAADQRKQR